MDVQGKRVTLLGLGRHGGGVAAARWLARQGAEVTVTDQASAESLQSSINELAGEPIAAWRLGGHAESDFDQAEIVVVNPAARPGHPFVERAAAHGALITTELDLFLERFPGRAIGVTGSNGKSTTAAMIAEILIADGRDAYLGGNIGRSLLADLSTMNELSWAVIEISSFQLAWLSPECPTPEVSVLTNFAPNHLDWHGDVESYARAKRRMFTSLPARGAAVMRPDERGHPLWADVSPRASTVVPWPEDAIPKLQVPGRHNVENAAAAAA
ncbi:MAG TPA: Mur ligase family protein, partial [Pirellulales bacterium]